MRPCTRRARDVQSVVHHHAYGVLPFTITAEPLRPVVHTASVIGAEIPVWDIRTRFGATDMLVRSIEQGRDLAAALADNTCVLIRGHGAVVVGASIERAVLTAIYLQVNANVLLQALPLGAPEALARRGDRALGRSAVLAARARSKLGVFLPTRRRRSVLIASGSYFRFLQVCGCRARAYNPASAGRTPRRTRTTTLGDHP